MLSEEYHRKLISFRLTMVTTIAGTNMTVQHYTITPKQSQYQVTSR